jgi:Kef-type K+ transport system membrane component KefB
MHNDIIFSLFLIFSGAAVLATLALFSRQSLLVAYIILGALLGPWGGGFISDPEIINDVGDIGIIFLLFLLGLNLQPQNLLKLLRETTFVTILSAGSFAVIGIIFSRIIGLSWTDAYIIGTCLMFSSTIIGLKLLPTTILHHQKTGEILISILLLQDFIAILALLVVHNTGTGSGISIKEGLTIIIGLPGLTLFAFLVERYILMPVIRRFNRIHEYLFLVAIAWCLSIGQLAELCNLSFEIGAFIAGISIAQSLISRFIAESLKPLRDFFLILFFFSLGAKINIHEMKDVLVYSAILAVLMLLVKPMIFHPLLKRNSAMKDTSWEVGVRIGQLSEFSLLLSYSAHKVNMLSQSAYYLIQASTVISFILSSYWIVNCYPTPIAVSDKLRRD